MPEPNSDSQFSLANERTFLAWIRTSLAMLAAGVAAARALNFDSEVWRWVVAGPPIAAAILISLGSARRWRDYEDAMREQRPLPLGRDVRVISLGLAIYAVAVLVASVVDG